MHVSPHSDANSTKLTKYVNSDDPCVLPKNDIEVVKQSNVGLLLKIYLSGPDTESRVHEVTRVAIYY